MKKLYKSLLIGGLLIGNSGVPSVFAAEPITSQTKETLSSTYGTADATSIEQSSTKSSTISNEFYVSELEQGTSGYVNTETGSTEEQKESAYTSVLDKLGASTRQSITVLGGVPANYDEMSGKMTLGSGEISNVRDWGGIDILNIKVIEFTDEVRMAPNYTSLDGMFNGMTSLTTIVGTDKLDTSDVTNMSYMFFNVGSLTSVDVSNWDTRNVTNMSHMFFNASSLTSVDVSNWDTGKVTNMQNMFYGVSSLTSVDVSNWDTRNVTNMYGLFYGDSSLTSVDVSNWDTGKVTNMQNMFCGVSSLTSVDVSNWDTGKVTNMQNMFHNASNLTSVDVSNWDTGNVTKTVFMFFNASSLTSVDVSNWDTGNVTDMSSMFSHASKLTSVNVSNWDTGKVTNMHNMFSYTSSLTSVDVSNWDTRNVTNMSYMFAVAGSLTSVDVSNWDTRNVKDMSGMFSSDGKLTSVDVSNWDTKNITNMNSMFYGVGSLTSVDVSNWDTRNVKDMSYMFSGASSITSLDVSNWDTGNVTAMSYMFRLTSRLRELTLGAKFQFVGGTNAHVPEISPSRFYTGKWQNVGTGTFGSPNGSNVFNSNELMMQYEGTTMADTYVWQPTDQNVVYVHDSILYVGDSWSPEDNFDSAIDHEGNQVPFENITVTGMVDTEMPRDYEVTYSYDGVSAIATITVKDPLTAVNVYDSTIYVGDSWSPEDNFDSAVDRDGNQVPFENITVTGTVDTETPGDYEVTYRYGGLSVNATITVKEADDSEKETETSTSPEKPDGEGKPQKQLPQTGTKPTVGLSVIGGVLLASVGMNFMMRRRKK